jgi:hypothetical protein
MGDLKRLLTYSGMVMAFRRTETLRSPCENRISPMGSSTTCATGIIKYAMPALYAVPVLPMNVEALR